MIVLIFLMTAIFLLGFSGVPACLLSSRSARGQRVSAALMLLGSVVGLAGTAAAFCVDETPTLSLSWAFQQSRFSIAADPLSALFLFPVFIVPVLGSFYGLGYWKQSDHPANGCRLGLSYGLLAGAMALVVIARDSVVFLIAWEVMALAAYFAAAAEDDKPDVRRAGWIYLVATHIGTLCLLALFACWRHATGSFALEPGHALSAGVAATLFVLAVIGFGFKAGLMPLHVWLPGAHANAPSHVSAVMSGVMLKMGIYGIVRMTALLPAGATWWGAVLLTAGAASSVAGIAFAIGQRDLKRILAYSSIENIGIIAMGVGLALLGRSLGHADWVVLGLGGALLHVLNHSLFKALLFFNAGAVIHAIDTREIDQMGGLGQRLPRVMALFIVGAVAICALPPLNGFASEWLLYVGLFRTLGFSGGVAGAPAAALAAVALAMTGALAVACFVKVLGTVFLGTPRNKKCCQVHEPGAFLWVPMLVLAVGCVVIGIFPLLMMPLLNAAVRAWVGQPTLLSVAAVFPLSGLVTANLALAALVASVALVLKRALQTKRIRPGLTWDCGYAYPTGRMQYTGSSFGDFLVTLTAFMLWPKRCRTALRGHFPRPSAFKSRVTDTVLDRLVLPLFRAVGSSLPRLRVLQQGQTHLYVLYIAIIMIVLLLWGNIGS